MTFLNATLIFGGLAAAIPIALHLLSRRPPKRITFPSIQLLRAKASLTQSRVNIKKWWLLAARIAVLTFLATAFAQPVTNVTGSTRWISIFAVTCFGICLLLLASAANYRKSNQSFTKGMTAAGFLVLLLAALWGVVTFTDSTSTDPYQTVPQAVAIIVDNSPTSAWVDNDGPRLERMKTICTTFIDDLPTGSQICVIDRSTKTSTLTIDKNSVRNKTRQLEIVQSPQPMKETIEIALGVLDTSRLETRHVLIFSDLTEYSWGNPLDFVPPRLSNPEGSIYVTVFDLGQFTGKNWGISPLQLADQSPPAETPTPITFSVYSEETVDAQEMSITAELEMFENDQTLPMVQNGEVLYPKTVSVDRSSLTVKKNASQDFFLNLPALPVGTHHGRIRLIGQDALAIDDIRYFSVKVLPPSKVLIVSHQPEESQIVSNAIGATSAITATSEYDTDEISFEDLPIVRLENYDLAVLIDPPNEESIARNIQQYLDNEGKVLATFGERGDLESNSDLWFQAKARKWRSPEPGTFLQPVDLQHSAFHALTDDVPWSNHRVQQYWQVIPNEADHVIAKYAGTEHPAVLERKIVDQDGNRPHGGKLMIITTPFPAVTLKNRRWNQLFGTNAWPAWLLCRQSIEYLTDRGAVGCNATVGNGFAYRIKKEAAELTASKGFLFEPNNPIPSPILGLENSEYLRVGDVGQSGTYWIRGKGLESGFSANLPELATRATRVETSNFSDQFAKDRWQVITQLDEMTLQSSQTANNIPLHSPIILLAAIFLILEQILGNRFYQGKNAAES